MTCNHSTTISSVVAVSCRLITIIRRTCRYFHGTYSSASPPTTKAGTKWCHRKSPRSSEVAVSSHTRNVNHSTLHLSRRSLGEGGTLQPFNPSTLRQTAGLGAVVASREAADDNIKREIPLKIRLMPMSVPIAQIELEGQCAQIRIPSRSVMEASTNTQPAFTRPRMLK